jgi:hypothetical protein
MRMSPDTLLKVYEAAPPPVIMGTSLEKSPDTVEYETVRSAFPGHVYADAAGMLCRTLMSAGVDRADDVASRRDAAQSKAL